MILSEEQINEAYGLILFETPEEAAKKLMKRFDTSDVEVTTLPGIGHEVRIGKTAFTVEAKPIEHCDA